jgi:hypothetical protein
VLRHADAEKTLRANLDLHVTGRSILQVCRLRRSAETTLTKKGSAA